MKQTHFLDTQPNRKFEQNIKEKGSSSKKLHILSSIHSKQNIKS